MALIELALPVTSIKGSVGGVTFQQNRSGQIMRTRPKTHKSSSFKQQVSHQDHQRFLSDWQGLSFTNRQLWNDYADVWQKPDFFGTDKNLTGQNWFESINRNLDTVGSSPVFSPPAHILPENIVLFSLLATSTFIRITFFTFFNPPDNALFIRLTGPTRRVSDTIRSELRFAGIFFPGPYSNLDLTALWEQTFNMSWPPSAVFTGWRICVSLQTCNVVSGLISPALITCAIMLNLLNGIGTGIIGNTFQVNANPGIGTAQVGISLLII